ncbi:MAG: SAM-dependent methyltransferase [Acidimicrobiales bacterium]
MRLLSLCGGEARDVVPVLDAHPKGPGAQGLVVELDEVLARRADEAAQRAGLVGLEVRCADAADPRSFCDVLPVDVLLLCGIFGNIERRMVREVVERVPTMVAEDGFVIWTRGGHDGEDDPRPEVRRWFVEAGMPEKSFEGPPESYGVGVNRVPHGASGALGDARLFDFIG